jgi:hypothetical protein
MGEPLCCQACGETFHVYRALRRTRVPRSSYLESLREGEPAGPSSRALANAAIVVFVLMLLVAVLALAFVHQKDLADAIAELACGK